jgi:hypothetical protein
LVTTLALLAAPASTMAAEPEIQHFTWDGQVDPELSGQFTATCGFEVVATISGRTSEIVVDTGSGDTREILAQSVIITFTNPATGESVTVRNALQPHLTVSPTSATTAHVVLTRSGLNFLFIDSDGTQASAGRQVLVLEVTFDATGNIISIVPTLETRTPHLASLAALVCPALAA